MDLRERRRRLKPQTNSERDCQRKENVNHSRRDGDLSSVYSTFFVLSCKVMFNMFNSDEKFIWEMIHWEWDRAMVDFLWIHDPVFYDIFE